MSYAKSRARKSFEERVLGLKRTARSVSFKNNGISHDVRELVYHAAVFETSAALEEYVKQIFEDYHFSLLRNGSQVKDIPSSLRSYLFFFEAKSLFLDYMYHRDEKRLIGSIDFNSSVFEAAFEDNLYNASFDMKKVLSGRKYPSPKNWEGLFYRLGLQGVFSHVDPIIKRSSKWMLTSFNDVRTAIAHESPPELNINDICMQVDNMRDLIRGVDRVMFRHICGASGKSAWPA